MAEKWHELQTFPVVSPWYHIGSDTKKVTNYILAISDYFSKLVHANPTEETKEACVVYM